MKPLIFIHTISAILFIGNIMTAAFWKMKAEFTKDETHVHRTVKNIMLADYIFTIPSTIGLLGSGFLLAFQSNYSLQEINWLTVSIGLFILTGVIWLSLLLPLQRKMMKYSGTPFNDKKYWKISRTWDVIGTISVLLPVNILYLMIAKPF
ncbi:membrane protein [Compostibacillus humi]|uniref:Membrane protein n=1 Tax=Compostibacillus humi TaxID=1245525 RepID=A0A8J2ZQG5_9BACI|nr:DUF2269 family protein [Compostibacillus humi]GGH71573.1 membrane protein [Compostibacillus humi]